MSPAELKTLNVAHFQKVLERTVDLLERARLERFIVEERVKPDSAYPVDNSPRAAPLKPVPRGA